MFKESIKETVFSTCVAESYFSNIQAISGDEPDCSFISTLRALLASRMTSDEKLRFISLRSAPSRRYIDRYSDSPNDFICSVGVTAESAFQENRLAIVNIRTSDDESRDALMEAIQKRFLQTSWSDGWLYQNKITAFFAKSFRVHCFTNPGIRSTIVFASNINIERYHYLQCAVFAYLPWFFNKERTVNEHERALIHALDKEFKDSPNEYIRCLEVLAEDYDFKTKTVEKMLRGFETQTVKRYIDDLNESIRRTNYEIDNLNNQIVEKIKNVENLNYKLLAYQLKANDTGDENVFMNYFMKNKNLELIYSDDDEIRFLVKGYITIFNETVAEQMINNVTRNNILYRYASSKYTIDDIKYLLTKIFLDRECKIRSCAAYTFSLNGNCNGIDSYSYGYSYNTYLPNPHIQEHHCLGDYRRVCEEYVRQHDYVQALEYFCASCCSLNFVDHVVMSDFINAITDCFDSKKFIEIDGEVYTCREAITKLKSMENPELKSDLEGEESV